MTPDKWETIWKESDFSQRILLRLYRVFYSYTGWAYLVLLVVISLELILKHDRYEHASEQIIAVVFALIAPLVFVYMARLGLWITLRVGGCPAEYLRY